MYSHKLEILSSFASDTCAKHDKNFVICYREIFLFFNSGLNALVPDFYRCNFLGTKFIVYDAQPPNAGTVISRSHSTHKVGSKQISTRAPAGNYPVAHISYELNVLGSR